MTSSAPQQFHHAVVKVDGAETLLSRAQYDAMPLRDRVKLILSGEVIFYDAADKVVPSTQALMRQSR